MVFIQSNWLRYGEKDLVMTPPMNVNTSKIIYAQFSETLRNYKIVLSTIEFFVTNRWKINVISIVKIVNHIDPV